MRATILTVLLVAGLVAATQIRGSATPQVVLVSPPVSPIGADEQIICSVTNADDVPHTISVKWCQSDGTCSTYAPQQVPAHGQGGAGGGLGSGVQTPHCEIIADGHEQFYRAVLLVHNFITGEFRLAVPFN